MAPRPNVGPKLETVWPCQTRAWFSKYTKPKPLIALTARKLNSFVSEQPPMNEMPSQRFTVRPLASFSTKELSRVFLVHCAISPRASSQEMSCQSVAPGRRTCGFVRRLGLSISCSSEEPLGHSVPRLVG